MLDGTSARGIATTDDRIGAQRKLESNSWFEDGREWLGLCDLEQSVPILRQAGGKDEEHTAIRLSPQKVTLPAGIIGEERPDEMMSRLSSRPAPPGMSQQQRRKRRYRSLVLDAGTGEIQHRRHASSPAAATIRSSRSANCQRPRLTIESRRRSTWLSAGAPGAS